MSSSPFKYRDGEASAQTIKLIGGPLNGDVIRITTDVDELRLDMNRATYTQTRRSHPGAPGEFTHRPDLEPPASLFDVAEGASSTHA